ncbi:MAG: hypothetical protein GQ581_02755 [Methyloprofundus sp.]|nr:hypothetical protein [Methyloprofundus sp.]
MNKFSPLAILNLSCLLILVATPTFAEENINNKIEEPVEADDSFAWSDYHKPWMDDFQIHGFLSQGLFSTSGNNVYGKSKDSVSAGLTEIGLNLSYQALNRLSFAVQGLYRRAGESTGSEGDFSLDYAFMDYTFFVYEKGRSGIRAGRVRNPWGLYNATRDVAATHPTIFLPLAYFERSRSLLLSMDGGQFYSDYNTPYGDFTFTFNIGLTNPNDKELLIAITQNPNILGDLSSELSYFANLNYEIDNGKYIFAFSYANLNLTYDGTATDPYKDLNAKINTFMLSAQYNDEKFSLTGEYALQWNDFNNFPVRPDSTPISEHWYVQTGYRVLDNVQLTLRYDSTSQDISNRKEKKPSNTPSFLPAHLSYTKDIVFGTRWDITPSWMLRAEYHRAQGSSAVSFFDNPDLSKRVKDWNIYALQIAYQF